MQISIDPQGWLSNGTKASLPGVVVEQGIIRPDWWTVGNDTCAFRNLSRLSPYLDLAQVIPSSANSTKGTSGLALQFDVPERMSWTRLHLGTLSRDTASLPPGVVPYNSTIWLNGSEVSLSAPFLDVGHGCSGNSVFGSLGNCVCYQGQPISLDLLDESRAICNTAPGYVWGFSSYLLRMGLAFESAWMACCFTCYLWLSLRSGLVRKNVMRSAGPMKFALEFSEAVCEIERTASTLSEDDLRARLDRINVRYRPPSGQGEQEELRCRAVAAPEKRERWIDHTDTRVNEIETGVSRWRNDYWRRRKPTDTEVYEDLNWRIYQ